MAEEPCGQGHRCAQRFQATRRQGDDQTPNLALGNLGKLVRHRLEMPIRFELDTWPHHAKGEFRERRQVMRKQRLEGDVGAYIQTCCREHGVTFPRRHLGRRHPVGLEAR